MLKRNAKIYLFHLFLSINFIYIQSKIISLPSGHKEYGYLSKKETFCRNGPGSDYKILFKYEKKNIPIMIKHKIDNWYFTLNHENQECWININMVRSDKIFGVIKNTKIYIHRIPDLKKENIEILGFVSAGTIIEVKKIYPKWVYVKIDPKISGWIKKDEIWLPIEKQNE